MEGIDQIEAGRYNVPSVSILNRGQLYMDISVKTGSIETTRTQCLIIGLFESKTCNPSLKDLDLALNGLLSTLLKRGDITGQAGEFLLLPHVPLIAAERILLVGCGKEEAFNDAAFRRAVSTAATQLRGLHIKEATSCLHLLPLGERSLQWKVRMSVEILLGNLYHFGEIAREANQTAPGIKKIHLSITQTSDNKDAHRGIAEGEAIAAGVALAKDLGNLPGNICTPTYLAKQAEKLDRTFKSIKTKVLEEKDMKHLGMGSLLSVSRGSKEPAKLICMEYQGAAKSKSPLVLVGKGVTFDSGGISLKPGSGMDEMKYDMCGAASVLGALQACALLELPINVVGIIPTTENLPSSTATKPGDIVTSMSGQTIEILNTDAEGRLILCDALTYARKYKPEWVIDIATLTGACVVALGRHASGLLSQDDALADAILAAGQESGDRAWRMPLWDDYQDQLKSNFADMANIGGKEAGTITAACFLARFTKDLRWAHLDIAGTAWKSGSEKGGTGRPVPLLVQLLMSQCEGKD